MTTLGPIRNSATLNAVVLAGGRNSPEMTAATGVENRALTPIHGRAMLDYVVSALSAAPSVGQVFVVGDVPPGAGYQTVQGGETLLENLLAGVQAAQTDRAGERLLISTSDIPFLTPESAEDFVRQSSATDADLCCSFVPVELCYQKFPEMKRTAIKLREGRFTLGNLMLINPHFLRDHQAAITRAYAARKSPLKMGSLLGWGLLARLIAAQVALPALLTVPRLEAAVSRVLGGARAAGICSEYPEIGTDVDRPEDVYLARRLLPER